MHYILVRTYSDGCHMNKVYPIIYNSLRKALAQCEVLNQSEDSFVDKWIVMPVVEG